MDQPLFTRRAAVGLGAGLLASTALPARAAIPVANVPDPGFRIESGARLRVLRPAKYMEPDEVIFNENTRAFTAKTGIEVRVDYVNWPDMPVQVGVAFNTNQGADVIIAFGEHAHQFIDKLNDMTDLATYLGNKYGGWYDAALLYGRKWKTNEWIGVPMGGSGGPCLYRTSAIKAAGFDAIPKDTDNFLKLCKELKRIGKPCGFALSHAPGDAPAYANWLMWSHGSALVDEAGKVTLESPNTLRAIDFARAMQETMIPGTMAWDGASNNRAFISGDLGLTQNGVSVYYALKTSTDATQRALTDDTDHALMPFGLSPKVPQTALTLNALVPKYTRYPNAAKEYIRFMMEVEQYDKWLTGCLGYWSQPLKAYSQSEVWATDPKIKVYSQSMDTPYHDGSNGPVNAASSAVMANWILVDMFARVVTGQQSPQESMREAQRAAARWYR
jgi:multiple sugar transport system substrate-binding protein